MSIFGLYQFDKQMTTKFLIRSGIKQSLVFAHLSNIHIWMCLLIPFFETS